MQFKMEAGLLQRKDIDPSAGGYTTSERTNPVIDSRIDMQQQVYLGETTRQKSPLVFVFAAVIFLLVVSLFQK